MVTVTSPATTGTGSTLAASLKVIWDAPVNTGPPITGYDVQYRKGGASFEAVTHTGTTTTTTITGLDADTSYSVQVRAKNDEDTSSWSRLVTLKTNKENNAPPTFDTALGDLTTDGTPLTVNENTQSNQDVGTPVNASDDITTSLTYTLEGLDAALFSIGRSTGQIKTKSKLNHEDPACGYDANDNTTSCTYKVRVKVDDKAGGSISKEVAIKVVDVDEPPAIPTGLRVTATKDSGWSLEVTWNEPSNTGKPPIIDYDIEYRKYKSGTPKDTWQTWTHDGTDRSAKITTIRTDPADADTAVHLEPSTQYQVRVRAKNGEGDTIENWSSVVRGTTGKSNSRPAFDDTTNTVVERSIAENTGSGQNVGSAVSASDADSNTLKVQPGRAGSGLVHHRLLDGADKDEGGAGLRDAEQLRGDGKGERRAEEGQQRRRQIGEDHGQ